MDRFQISERLVLGCLGWTEVKPNLMESGGERVYGKSPGQSWLEFDWHDYNDLFRCVDAMNARGWIIDWRGGKEPSCRIWKHPEWDYKYIEHRDPDRRRAIALALIAALDAENGAA